MSIINYRFLSFSLSIKGLDTASKDYYRSYLPFGNVDEIY